MIDYLNAALPARSAAYIEEQLKTISSKHHKRLPTRTFIFNRLSITFWKKNINFISLMALLLKGAFSFGHIFRSAEGEI